MTVAAGGITEIPISVKKGSIVRWKFEVPQSTIQFKAMAILTGHREVIDISPKEKLKEAEAEYVATSEGVVTLEFDNYKAWLYSVTLTYDVSVIHP